MTIADDLMEQLRLLDDAKQQRLLNYARILSQTPVVRGEPGTQIAAATGYFDAVSLDEIEAAIQAGCEEVDWRGWE